MKNKLITIREYEHIKREDLTKSEFETLQSYCDKLHDENNTHLFTLHKDSVQAKQYVGLIQLKSGLTVEILPKISNGTLEADKKIFLKMLTYLREFKFKICKNADLKVYNMPLFEIFILMYLDETLRLLKKGLKSDYISYTDNLRFFKGKLNVSGQIKYNAAHKERFYMIHDEFSLDRPENRILKATLLYLQKKTRSVKNKNTILQCLMLMENVNASTAYEKDFSKITLSRNTSDYELLMMWSKVFLLGKSFTSFSGSSAATALLFDMNKVFEAYVGRYVKRIFESGETDCTVKLQEQSKYLFDEPPRFTLKPDIVVRGAIKAIMDTKWKRIKSDNDISQGDMYQMYAYSKRYNVTDIWLIYPQNEVNHATEEGDTPQCFISDENNNTIETRVHIFFVNLEKIEDSIGVLLEKVQEKPSN